MQDPGQAAFVPLGNAVGGEGSENRAELACLDVNPRPVGAVLGEDQPVRFPGGGLAGTSSQDHTRREVESIEIPELLVTVFSRRIGRYDRVVAVVVS